MKKNFLTAVDDAIKAFNNEEPEPTKELIDLHNRYTEDQLVNILVSDSLESKLIMIIIEKRIRLPENIHIAWVSPEYKDKIIKGKTKRQISSLVFHCRKLCDFSPLRRKFELSTKEIYDLINESAFEYQIVVKRRNTCVEYYN